MTIDEAIPRFINHLQVQARNPNTIKNNGYFLERFKRHFTAKASLELITYDAIMAFVAKYAKEGRLPGTVNKLRSSLTSFFSYLVDADHLDKMPFRRLKYERVNFRPPTPLDSEKRQRLFKAAWSRPDLWLLLHFYLGKGLRLSEALSLNISDVEGQNALRIEGKGKKVRHLHMTPSLREAVARHLEYRARRAQTMAMRNRRRTSVDKDALFISYRGSRLTPRGAQVLMGKIFSIIGLRFKIHWLRHAFAKQLLDGGAHLRVIQEILGHGDLKTTQTYLHIPLREIEDVLNKADRELANTAMPA